MKLFFCYERTIRGSWSPVCYHGEKPKPEKFSDCDSPCRTTVWPVPDDLISGDTPQFSALMKRFPAPEVAS
jgi:hypothetical protein